MSLGQSVRTYDDQEERRLEELSHHTPHFQVRACGDSIKQAQHRHHQQKDQPVPQGEEDVPEQEEEKTFIFREYFMQQPMFFTKGLIHYSGVLFCVIFQSMGK